MRTLHVQVVDVFTDRPFAGNPLAVVLDADDLETAQLQALAQEFNLSETSFPLQPPPGADYGLRIFTPGTELPFAGHPSVGAAWVLAQLGRIAPGSRTQSCGAGLLPVEVAPDGGPVTLTGGTASYGEERDPLPLLAAVGLEATDLVGVAPRSAGAGIDWAYLLVHEAALARVSPDAARLRGIDGTGVSVTAWDGERALSRVFAGGAAGVFEDPATGSAALGLGAYLVGSGLLDGSATYVVEQGREMGRPSRLECTVTARDGAVLACTVAGSVVPVWRGEVRVP